MRTPSRLRSVIWLGSTVLGLAAAVACGSSGGGQPSPDAGADTGAADSSTIDANEGGTADAADAADASDAGDASDAKAEADAGGATLYHGDFLSSLAFDDVDRSFRFYTLVTYQASPDAGASGTPGTIATIELTSLKAASTTVSKAETVGTTVSKAAVPVSPSGRFEVAFASMKIPGDANPISGRDIEMENVTITGVFTKTGRFCARIAATVTMPVIVTLEPEKNIALYDPVTEGDARPVHVLADFECAVPAE